MRGTQRPDAPRVSRLAGLSPGRLTLLCALFAGATTVAVSLLPYIRFAYEAPTMHAVFETLAAVVALLVAFLVLGRFRQSRRLQELLLVLALAVVAVANLLLAAVPSALDLGDDSHFGDWAPVAVRLLGAGLLTASALVPVTVVTRRRRTAQAATALVLGVVVAVVVALRLAGDLPPALDPTLDLSRAERPLIVGHPMLLAAQVLGGLLYGVATVAFTRQATRTGDELVRWLGAGCALAAFARVNYVLFPSLYSDYVYTGDLLRLGFFGLLAVGASREIASFWTARARLAVLEERRRLARDLHDGLTQELTYITAQSRLLSRTPADPAVIGVRIHGAASRALDEARTAITALTRMGNSGFNDVLLATADGLASRYDAKVELDVDEAVSLSPAQGDAVLRIVAEAFRNAVLHGGARRVCVELKDDPLRLVVRDDGQGFDVPASKDGGGFGLTSMRERAEGLGAAFSISSSPGGTAVRVEWP